MANRQISQLTAGTIGTTDLLVFQDAAGSSEAKKATVQDVLDLVPGGGGMQTVKVSLTSADILSLNGSSFVQLLAGQGAGTVINVVKAWFKYNFVTTAYTGGGTLSIYFGTSTFNPAVISGIGNVLNNTSDVIARPQISGTVSIVSTSTVSNVGIYLYNNIAQTLGDSTLDVYLTYDVITL